MEVWSNREDCGRREGCAQEPICSFVDSPQQVSTVSIETDSDMGYREIGTLQRMNLGRRTAYNDANLDDRQSRNRGVFPRDGGASAYRTKVNGRLGAPSLAPSCSTRSVVQHVKDLQAWAQRAAMQALCDRITRLQEQLKPQQVSFDHAQVGAGSHNERLHCETLSGVW